MLNKARFWYLSEFFQTTFLLSLAKIRRAISSWKKKTNWLCFASFIWCAKQKKNWDRGLLVAFLFLFFFNFISFLFIYRMLQKVIFCRLYNTRDYTTFKLYKSFKNSYYLSCFIEVNNVIYVSLLFVCLFVFITYITQYLIILCKI